MFNSLKDAKIHFVYEKQITIVSEYKIDFRK